MLKHTARILILEHSKNNHGFFISVKPVVTVSKSCRSGRIMCPVENKHLFIIVKDFKPSRPLHVVHTGSNDIISQIISFITKSVHNFQCDCAIHSLICCRSIQPDIFISAVTEHKFIITCITDYILIIYVIYITLGLHGTFR